YLIDRGNEPCLIGGEVLEGSTAPQARDGNPVVRSNALLDEVTENAPDGTASTRIDLLIVEQEQEDPPVSILLNVVRRVRPDEACRGGARKRAWCRCGRRQIHGNKRRHVLYGAILDDLKLIPGETLDRLAVIVEDTCLDLDVFDLDAELGRCLRAKRDGQERKNDASAEKVSRHRRQISSFLRGFRILRGRL